MPSADMEDTLTLTWKKLQQLNYSFDSSNTRLVLAEDQVLTLDKVLRIVPKRRLVAYGTWQDKAVVAKLFFDPQHAKRHMEKDAEGVRTMRENKIPTPALYYQGYCANKRVYVLLFERIFDAKSLNDLWWHKENVEEVLPILKAVTVEIATQHVLGVVQQDLHLKNFLLTRKTIFTLDGGQIEKTPYLLPKKESMQNLALFLSQLGVGFEKYQEALFRHYAKARGWLLKKEDIVELFLSIKKWNEERWRQFDKKIVRESTDFSVMKDFSTFGVFNRHYLGPEFVNFLRHPDAIFNQPVLNILKAGRSSTVIGVKLDGRDYVVKRYNMKSFWHRLRRSLRVTRAYTSWRLAQKLQLFGVATAKPVAFIDKTFFGLKGQCSYYVMEFVPGEQAGDYFERFKKQPEKVDAMIREITMLLRNTAKVEITQGDLKITNILIDAEEKPVLIDLDGAAEHLSISSLRSAWRKEIKRFLRNFEAQPDILEKFKQAFKDS